MSEHRSRIHHVVRSLFGGVVVSGLILSGLATSASALDSAPSDTPTINQVIDSGDDPVVDPTVESERCARSRGKGDDCGDVDAEPIVEPEAEDEIPTTTTTTAAPVADPDNTVAGGGDQVVVPAPVDQVLSEETERTDPAPAATLPRTGSGVDLQVTVAFGLMGAGITILRLARRRRPATQA